ncbi:MAG: response regulator transcription factor [Planctomycetota bacterium]|jgi:FixJ family two-component response regulator
MCEIEQTVFIVDDDQAVLKGIKILVESIGIKAETFVSARDFLDGHSPARWGCLVLDIRMPEISGLELQKVLKERRISLPIIIVTGHGDAPTAVEAMKEGAFDFIEKPFSEQILLGKIQRALAQDAQARRADAEIARIKTKFAKLTKKEHEVMEFVVAGNSSKKIAFELGVSHKTVEAHRTNIMEKLGVKSAVQLTRLAMEANLG